MDASALASAESWLSWVSTAKLIAAFLVALGVVIEFGSDWIARPFEKTVNAAREAQIASLEKQTEEARSEIAKANARVAEANERAATLEKQASLANLKAARVQEGVAWRKLTVEQLVALRVKLTTRPSHVTIAFILNDPESKGYATSMSKVFGQANWAAYGEARSYAFDIVEGVRIPDSNDPDTTEFIRSAFKDAAIPFFVVPPPPPTEAHHLAPPPTSSAIIVVGSKQPPELFDWK